MSSTLSSSPVVVNCMNWRAWKAENAASVPPANPAATTARQAGEVAATWSLGSYWKGIPKALENWGRKPAIISGV